MNKLVINGRFGISWHVIRSSGLALHQACQKKTANRIKKKDFMAECGRPAIARLLLRGTEGGFAAGSPLGVAKCHPPYPISSTPWMKKFRSWILIPGCSLRNRPALHGHFGSLCSGRLMWRPITHHGFRWHFFWCYGSQGPSSRSTSFSIFHLLNLPAAVCVNRIYDEFGAARPHFSGSQPYDTLQDVLRSLAPVFPIMPHAT